MAHQERRERSQTLVNPHTADSSYSHLPGLGSSHLRFGLHLLERAGLEPLRVAASQPTATVWHCHPVPHIHAWMWGINSSTLAIDRGAGEERGWFQPSESNPVALLGDFAEIAGRRSQAGAKGLERS